MSGTNMTQVGPKLHTGWLYAAAAVVVLVVAVTAGYGLLQSNNSGVGTGPVPGMTASPSASPTPAAIAGTETCRTTTAATTSTLNGVEESRGERLDCTTTMSDARLTGTGTAILNSEQQLDGTWLGWGTREIRNTNGSWSGPFAITSTASATSMTFDFALLGVGGYDGLLFRGKAVMTATSTTLTGIIIPDPAGISGHQTCDSSGGTDTQVGDITSTRGVVLTCVDNVNDSRVHGTATIRMSIDMQRDGSADLWGTLVIANAGGTWEGFWFGTVDQGYTTHHVEGMLRGTGDYAGLLLRVSVTGDDQSGYDLVNRIFPAG